MPQGVICFDRKLKSFNRGLILDIYFEEEIIL